MSGAPGGAREAASNSVVRADPLEKAGFEQKQEGDEGMSAVVICKHSRHQSLSKGPEGGGSVAAVEREGSGGRGGPSPSPQESSVDGARLQRLEAPAPSSPGSSLPSASLTGARLL